MDWSGVCPAQGLCFSPQPMDPLCVPSPELHPGDKEVNQRQLLPWKREHRYQL